MDIRIIGDENTVMGFRLAGVSKGYIVEDETSSEEAFEKCRDSGIVIVTEKVAEMIRGNFSEEELFPLVVEIHDMGGPIEKEDRLRVLMRQVIGVDIKKEEEK